MRQVIPQRQPAATKKHLMLQRKCACGNHRNVGECGECTQKKGLLQRKTGKNFYLAEVPPIVYDVLRSPEQPLDAETRAFFEPRFGRDFSRVPPHANQPTPLPVRLSIGASHDHFEQEAEMASQYVVSQSVRLTSLGHDFSGVRIHTDSRAAESAQAVNALAYTVGRDVVFGPGQYAPHSREGKRLLAHELTHVLQQRGSTVPMISRQKASFGEKLSCVWNIGAIACYRASEIAEESLKAAQQTGLPGLYNGPADAWRHCYWNCRMTDVIGEDHAAFVAKSHEEQDENNPTAERMMDTWNNEEGRRCSGDCDSCCQKKLDTGKLWTLENLGGGKWGGKVQSSKPSSRAGTPSGAKYEKY